MESKKDWIKLEDAILAPYAQKSINSKGRDYKEEDHYFRSPYQRDRDRIIHSRAFRRLEYKTQVFANYQGDHYRTRLTHTIEVAGISRTISRALNLNEDLTEAIALAHDVGHPPYGHSGEYILNELMKEYGGFEHNLQSLRIVEKLEKKYPQFEGLNLTYEVRKGLIKHKYNMKNFKYRKENFKDATLEAQVVDIADEIAYNSHDLDDGLTSKLLTEESLAKVTIWKENYKKIKKSFPNISSNRQQAYNIRTVINFLVTDLLENSLYLILENNITSQAEVFKTKKKLISFSAEIKEKNIELKKFLYQNFYEHPKVLKTKAKAKGIIESLFNLYLKNPRLFLQAPEKVKYLPRVVCDYIAGMTDRFAYKEYHRLKAKH